MPRWSTRNSASSYGGQRGKRQGMPRKPGPIPSLGTTGDVRRSMIERAKMMRARLAAKLARDDLGARSRRTAFRQLRQIEERLVDLRDGE